MSKLTKDEITKLHKKYAPTNKAYDSIYTQCCIVESIALQFAKRIKGVNIDLVSTGALLHDIGVYELYLKDNEIDEANYIRHGILGYEVLKSEGLAENICRIASHHTGVGITKADVLSQELPIPEEDYFAENDEELIVMYADKFHSKSVPPRFNTFESYKEHVSRFGKDKVVKFEIMKERFGLPDLPISNF